MRVIQSFLPLLPAFILAASPAVASGSHKRIEHKQVEHRRPESRREAHESAAKRYTGESGIKSPRESVRKEFNHASGASIEKRFNSAAAGGGGRSGRPPRPEGPRGPRF